MNRRVLWLQLIIGWLPVGALFTMLIVVAHQTPLLDAALISLRMIVAGAILGTFVRRLAERLPWPHPFRVTFAMAHLVSAVIYAAAWILVISGIESALRGRLALVEGPGLTAFLLLGVWLYIMVAAVTYATLAAERTAYAEFLAARAQLATLRAQLNPHFLFNALHSVMHLIPIEPARAAQAAEQLGDLLRHSIEEDRDLVTLAEEWRFVERYLDIERLRFGERLHVETDIADDATHAAIPSFALLTLVENAVRHSVQERLEPTTVSVRARVDHGALLVTVHDTGAGMRVSGLDSGDGTGHRRLRDRLMALYGASARLDLLNDAGATNGGFSARLTIPLNGERR